MKNAALLGRALLGLVFFDTVVATVLFASAGTFHYWQAWSFLAQFATLSLTVTLYLYRRDPQLLARRTQAGPTAEKTPRQKVIQSFASAVFLGCVLAPGIDHRLHGARLPAYATIAGQALVTFGWFIVFFAFRENTFASATVEIAAEQRVITTGPYAIVRHPMYSGGILFILGIPIALGSAWGILGTIPLILVIVWRLVDEEAFLRKNLPGYTDYCSRTAYRLVPHVW